MVSVNPVLYDCIVAGSGPAGSMCAQTLIEGGLSVLMLDGGLTPSGITDLNASTLHDYRNETSGNDSMSDLQASLLWKQTGAAEQLTLPRRYVVEATEKWLPVRTSGFQLMESLAYGGLGAAWGLGCYQFTNEELQLCGLPPQEMSLAYETVAQRIGIAYSPDDIAGFVMNKVTSLQAGINIDENSESLMLKYEKHKKQLQRNGFFLGKPPLAILTEPKEDRKATDYSNFDFYTNRGLSAWRPDVTLAQLRKKNSFHYQGRRIVTSFQEINGLVEVKVINMDDHSIEHYKSKKLIITCGATGTARIAARSFELFNHSMPLLCNPYQYITALQTKRLGKVAKPTRVSTAQLAIILKSEVPGEDGMGSVYSYDALPMVNVLKQVPLGFTDARVLMQYLLPAMVIAGVHHPDRRSDWKYLQLVRTENQITGDELDIHFDLSAPEKEKVNVRTSKFRRLLRKLGCLPVKTVQPPYGASIHYAGTLPFDETGKPLTTNARGLLAGTNQVFIADSSPFCFLPAKGLTFTIMANAHRTALQVLKNE